METHEGLSPNLSVEAVDVHGLTTTFQRSYALPTDTPTPMVDVILWSTRAPVLQAIKELARTSRTSTEMQGECEVLLAETQ
jgi:hypothetical protein